MGIKEYLHLFPESDQQTLLEIEEGIDGGHFKAAIVKARTLLNGEMPEDEEIRSLFKAILAGQLIDAGVVALDGEAISEGLHTFEDPVTNIRGVMPEDVVEYNLGNAKDGLYRVQANKAQRFTAASIQLLTEAKNHYWKAVNAIEANGGIPSPQLFVNLANALDNSGRVVDALTWYHKALTVAPGFPMALLNRAECLLRLKDLSDMFTLTLIHESLEGFKQALASEALTVPHQKGCEAWIEHIRQGLANLDATEEEITEQHRAVENDAADLDSFRVFCNEQRLALCEHALYCACPGVGGDDLSILKKTGPVAGDFVPKYELYLNRIKSEFAMARSLYAQTNSDSEIAADAMYTDLLGNEANGLEIEGLRTAFRLCFGILDKIARGVCDLFELAKKNEPVCFDSFWKNPRAKALSGQPRWEEINALKNVPLVALYSLETDLNAKNGEWADLKEWRNALEHNLLLIGKGKEFQTPLFDKEWVGGIVWVEHGRFRERTLQLLQFTASAIFSFAFCVRIEGIRLHKPGGVPFTLTTV